MSRASAGVELLLALALVVGLAHIFGRFAGRLRQPRVMGELLAGIALGPSLLGRVAPDLEDELFSSGVVVGVGAVAQLGLVLFMFLVGLDLELGHLRGQGRRAIVISYASILAPLALGVLLALFIHPALGAGASPVGFAGFIGVALCVTAFPVLVRILQEFGLDRSRIGSLSLTCAAIDDLTAWGLLAVVLALARSGGLDEVTLTIAAAVLFVAVMLMVVRRVFGSTETIPVALAVAFALACAWYTDLVGVHAIFGAFVAGVVMPRAGPSRERIKAQLEPMVNEVLLPVYFVAVGLSVQLGCLSDAYLWGVVGLTLLVAVAGKFGGATLAARATGESWNDSVVVGVLMNTRGLTGLVILTVGLEVGVITETVYTIMVIVALVTTFMAAPVLQALGVRSAAVTSMDAG